jgi:hypothetical protein
LWWLSAHTQLNAEPRLKERRPGLEQPLNEHSLACTKSSMAAGHWLFDSLTGSAFPIAIAARCTAPCRAATWCRMLHRVATCCMLHDVATWCSMLHRVALAGNTFTIPISHRWAVNPSASKSASWKFGTSLRILASTLRTGVAIASCEKLVAERVLQAAGTPGCATCNARAGGQSPSAAAARCMVQRMADVRSMQHPHRPTRWPRVESANTWTVSVFDVALTH